MLSIDDAHTVDIEVLAKLYLQCKEAYYNTDKPIVDDMTFDMYETILRQRAPHHKSLQWVGTQMSSRDKVKLPYWTGSQSKIYPNNTSAFDSWSKRIGDDKVVATAKLDGLSAVLIITVDNSHLYSRGNGRYAKDWTHHYTHMHTLRHVVQQLQKTMEKNTRIVLRGEAIMSKVHYKQLQKSFYFHT